jgi:hypothetical protein
MKPQTLLFLSSVVIVACSGSDPNPNGSGGTSSGIEPGSNAPPPHSLCPSHEPMVGSACTDIGEECTYGKCTDPAGDVVLECKASKWRVVGGGICRSADAGPPHDASPSCSSGGMGNANGACSADLGMFQSAEQSCTGEHQVLTAFTADEKCGAGSSNSAAYTCCTSLPSGCSQGGMANGNGLCSTDDSLFGSAEQSCAELHQTVVAFSSDDKCGAGSSNSATYTCCP